ncbi:MAG: hypothetical protein ACW97Z_02335 [Candidatus Hodarchaeales archaeon]|jgi:hypothetical protein
MPLGFRKKKKKKKDLPTPPDLSRKVDKSFQKVLGELYETVPPKNSGIARPPQSSKRQPQSALPEPPGPPREFSPPPFNQSPPSELPPPPFEDSRKSSYKSTESEGPPVQIFGNEALTDEIQAELRSRSFGSSILEKAPTTPPAPRKTTEDLTRIHFQESRRDYIEAGNKNLELNFFEYAATNYACAILCDLISNGVDEAKNTFAQISSGKPSGVVDNVIFDNVRLLIEATRSKNFTFLNRAEKAIRNNLSQLYPEDVAIIERGIKSAKAYFGLE